LNTPGIVNIPPTPVVSEPMLAETMDAFVADTAAQGSGAHVGGVKLVPAPKPSRGPVSITVVTEQARIGLLHEIEAVSLDGIATPNVSGGDTHRLGYGAGS
jgi:hypothetical protein